MSEQQGPVDVDAIMQTISGEAPQEEENPNFYLIAKNRLGLRIHNKSIAKFTLMVTGACTLFTLAEIIPIIKVAVVIVSVMGILIATCDELLDIYKANRGIRKEQFYLVLGIYSAILFCIALGYSFISGI